MLKILIFSTSDISYQICYCCQKLEICLGLSHRSVLSNQEPVFHDLSCKDWPLSHTASLTLSQSDDCKQGQRGQFCKRGHVRERPCAREANLCKRGRKILVPDWITQICERGRDKFLTFDSNSTRPFPLTHVICLSQSDYCTRGWSSERGHVR